MSSTTHPYTPTSPGWPSLRPRPLGPIRAHPRLDSIQTPVLPTPPRPSVFHSATHGIYRLSTHLVPSAYPRLIPDIPLPAIPAYSPDESTTERLAKVGVVVEEVQRMQDAYAEGSLGGVPSKKQFWNCVNRYVCTSTRSPVRRVGTPGAGTGITLFLAHANGFHKEIWETMVRGLLDAPAGKMVDEVWAWDAVQHGDAAVMNADSQSGIFDWLDNSRDIANFLLHYLPEHPEAAVLPTRLARLPASLAKARQEHGYSTRKLVVVGHSFGGCTSLRVAFDFPKLFSSFVLVDPVICRPPAFHPGHASAEVLAAFTRRDRWSSREEALRLLKRSSFFGAWHPDVLQRYVDYALIDDSEGGVTLKMSGLQEGLSFAHRVLPRETWVMLERLDETIALHWVIPAKSSASKKAVSERVWRRPVNATNVVFHCAGHLVVQEAPFELARDVSDFLMCKYGPSNAHL